MLSNLSSNQARWDLICQQEARAGMAESTVSTSSSSGTGGGLCESRRDSLEQTMQGNVSHHYRLSRSSGEGDNDNDSSSDNQHYSPYPYLPLDSVDATYQQQPLSPRRHSLPPFFLSDNPLLRLCSAAATKAEQPLEAALQQQMSLIEKNRRSSAAAQELRKQNSELLANVKWTKRRRVFASHRGSRHSNSSTESNSATTAVPKVTFHLNEAEDENKHHVNLFVAAESLTKRRGSAPCTLLLNQINKIANSASKAATTASREHSPGVSSLTGANNRRSSLPSDLIDVENPRGNNRAAGSGGGGGILLLQGTKAMKKRKLLRRKSAGAGDYDLASGSTSSEPQAAKSQSLHRKNPSLGKRGSRSSSFGGVGCSLKINGSNETCLSPRAALYSGRLSWHGKPGTKMALLRSADQPELLEENHCNGRRGSLPLELIPC